MFNVGLYAVQRIMAFENMISPNAFIRCTAYDASNSRFDADVPTAQGLSGHREVAIQGSNVI